MYGLVCMYVHGFWRGYLERKLTLLDWMPVVALIRPLENYCWPNIEVKPKIWPY